MIRRFHARNFGCLKEVSTPDLTPLHAFIGPNDSGKSTLLRAIESLVDVLAQEQTRQAVEPAIARMRERCGTNGVRLVAETSHGFVAVEEIPDNFAEFAGTGRFGVDSPSDIWRMRDTRPSTFPRDPSPIADLLREVASVRRFQLSPTALKASSPLIPDGEELRLGDDSGFGLPGVYDVIMNRGDDAFDQIVERVRQLFPNVKNVGLKNTSKTEKALQVELMSGERVPANLVSEGLLFFLAYLALAYIDPVRIVLIEEPENGLHPARIADVMAALRKTSEKSQVLIATHSPLVVNELQPNEVTVVTRDPEKGTQLRLLGDTPDFKARSKVYALGELWLSYADGIAEAPLLTGGQDHE